MIGYQLLFYLTGFLLLINSLIIGELFQFLLKIIFYLKIFIYDWN